MLEEKKINKVGDLTKRAIAINENLLAEEKKLVEALSEHEDFDYLKTLCEKINVLMRKEVLYNQAAQSVLQKR